MSSAGGVNAEDPADIPVTLRFGDLVRMVEQGHVPKLSGIGNVAPKASGLLAPKSPQPLFRNSGSVPKPPSTIGIRTLIPARPATTAPSPVDATRGQEALGESLGDASEEAKALGKGGRETMAGELAVDPELAGDEGSVPDSSLGTEVPTVEIDRVVAAGPMHLERAQAKLPRGRGHIKGNKLMGIVPIDKPKNPNHQEEFYLRCIDGKCYEVAPEGGEPPPARQRRARRRR